MPCEDPRLGAFPEGLEDAPALISLRAMSLQLTRPNLGEGVGGEGASESGLELRLDPGSGDRHGGGAAGGAGEVRGGREGGRVTLEGKNLFMFQGIAQADSSRDTGAWSSWVLRYHAVKVWGFGGFGVKVFGLSLLRV